MGARPLLAGFVACCVIVLSACAEEPAMDVSALRVTGQQQQLEAEYARLSPDGERLLYYRDQPCVRRLNGSGEHCVEEMDIRSAVWSPDGRRVAFSEGLVDREPDIWVLNVESGQVRNLTDDGVENSGVSTPLPAKAKVDVLPSWTPDGEHIRFARKGNEGTIDLVSVPAGGGEVTTIRSIPGRILQLGGLAWAGDTVAWAAIEETETEVWLAGPFSPEAELVLRGKQSKLSFSPDGKYLLAGSWQGKYEGDGPRLVPVIGGDPVPVASTKVAFPTWAPEGHALAYLDGHDSLQVVGEPGGEPRELRVDGKLTVPGDALSWAAGKLLLTVDGKPTVLTITG